MPTYINPLSENVLVALEPEAPAEDGLYRVHKALKHDHHGYPEWTYLAGEETRTLWGHVVERGRGRITRKGAFIETEIDIGSRVLIPHPAGSHLTISGEPHVILPEREILAVEAP